MQGKLKIHSENILPIIKKWLYSDKDIFVRELVSNASDAIGKLEILKVRENLVTDDAPYRIEIAIDKEKKTITISDNGLGMTAEEVEKYIAQLAFSGAEEFIQNYKSEEAQDQFIGHFGLGFYSAFMVSKNVYINTLSYKEGATSAYWSCDGSSDYTLEEGTRSNRGTDIILQIEDEEYLDPAKIRNILKTYCNFLPHPIYLEGEHINKLEPLWIKKASDCTEEEYLNFYRELYPFEADPIFWIHLNVDHPFRLKGILYFPKITPRFDYQTSKIKLFCNRVFVSDNCQDLFPNFLTVLRGAIDTPDIPLNVSRSYLQMDSTVRKLASHISKKIADRLHTLYTTDLPTFQKHWPHMEVIVKLGILKDEKFYEKAQEFLLWKTNFDEWIRAEDYIARHREAYEGKIFYTTSQTEESSFLRLYKEKKIDVIIAGGPLDTAIFNHLESALNIHFQRIDGGLDKVILDESKELSLLDSDGKTEAANIKEFIQSQMPKNIEVEAKSLASTHLPAFVMIEESSRRMRDYLTMTQKEMPRDILGKHTFVVNTNNPLISTIYKLKDKDRALSQALIEQVYDLSLLSQQELHPESFSTFINRSSDVLHRLATHITQEAP